MEIIKEGSVKYDYHKKRANWTCIRCDSILKSSMGEGQNEDGHIKTECPLCRQLNYIAIGSFL